VPGPSHPIDDHDPAVVTRAFREIWRARGEQLGAEFPVPDCPYSAAELAGLARQRRRPGYLPAGLATQDGRALLATLFPALCSWAAVEDSVVVNDRDAWGWFDYETDVEAPHAGTAQNELLDVTADGGPTLLTLNQYIVAGHDTLLATGRYLDEGGTWSRVASRIDGRMVSCRLDGPAPPDDPYGEQPEPGSLLVAYDLGATDRGPTTGARSSTRGPSGDRPATPRTTYDVGRFPTPIVHDLGQRRRDLVGRYLELGFHRRLGMSEDDYKRSMPALSARPASYAGRFEVPLLVETRIDWRTQAELAGIAIGGGRLDLDYVPLDARWSQMGEPYSAWFAWWGARFPDAIAPDEARAALAPDEAGADLRELVAMHVAHPELVAEGRYFEPLNAVLDGSYATGLTGFDDDILRTACLYWWRGRPEIGANLRPKAISICRPLLRGAAVGR